LLLLLTSFTTICSFVKPADILYKFLSTADCLIRWYCDDVDITGKKFTFEWEGSEEIAMLVENVENELLRFQWEDAEEGEYMEFKMSTSPVTGETILEVSDYAEEDEIEDQRQLCETQIKRLRQATGG